MSAERDAQYEAVITAKNAEISQLLSALAKYDGMGQANERLRVALRFYANGHHFAPSDPMQWESVSGEPDNWLCDDAGLATIEDGSIAKMVLRGQEIEWDEFDDDVQPTPIEGESESARPALGFDFIAHIRRHREFSERTFGPGPRVAGVLDHIRKELREVEAAPNDLEEWVDVWMLALDGAWRSGATPEEIVAQIVAKQTKNEARAWPDWKTAPAGKAIEHVRPITTDTDPAGG